jgi:two-component system LytT family response regulator
MPISSLQIDAKRPRADASNHSLRVLVADKDKLCRTRVRALLADKSNVEIVAECTQAREVLDALREHRPDLLLFDPRMPDGNAFELLAALPPESLPLLIFITAQDQYALKAFETKAFDFIMKPFDQKRFNLAIERARADLARTREGMLTKRQMDLIRQVRDVPEERLIVKVASRIVFLDLVAVDWIEADANYVVIHAKSNAYRMREPIGQMEKRVANYNFARIHRSVIVNMTRIKEVEPCNSGEYLVRLKNGKELPCSRNYNSAIRNLLHKGRSQGNK